MASSFAGHVLGAETFFLAISKYHIIITKGLFCGASVGFFVFDTQDLRLTDRNSTNVGASEVI